jgi:hypothetical protein
MIRSQGVGSERSTARWYAASSCRTSLRQFLVFSIAGCARKPPPTASPGRPPFVAEAAPEPIAPPGVCFAFDQDFIRNRYRSADLAFGSFTVSEEWPSGRHDESCSGEDGEVHVGAYEDHLGLETTETPSRVPWKAIASHGAR